MQIHKAEWHVIEEYFGGDKASIPKGMGECGGTLTVDPVVSPYENVTAAPMDIS